MAFHLRHLGMEMITMITDALIQRNYDTVVDLCGD